MHPALLVRVPLLVVPRILAPRICALGPTSGAADEEAMLHLPRKKG